MRRRDHVRQIRILSHAPEAGAPAAGGEQGAGAPAAAGAAEAGAPAAAGGEQEAEAEGAEGNAGEVQSEEELLRVACDAIQWSLGLELKKLGRQVLTLRDHRASLASPLTILPFCVGIRESGAVPFFV